jgi:hypothetical protein
VRVSLLVPRPSVRNNGPLASLAMPVPSNISGKIRLEIMVAGHRTRLAAFLAQSHPKAPVLCEYVLDLHAKRRADAREAEDHQSDQRAIAQTGVPPAALRFYTVRTPILG